VAKNSPRFSLCLYRRFGRLPSRDGIQSQGARGNGPLIDSYSRSSTGWRHDRNGARPGVPALHDVTLVLEQRHCTKNPIAELSRGLRPILRFANPVTRHAVKFGQQLGRCPRPAFECFPISKDYRLQPLPRPPQKQPPIRRGGSRGTQPGRHLVPSQGRTPRP